MIIGEPNVIGQENELSLRRGSLLLGFGFVVLIGIVGLTYIMAARSRSSFNEVGAAHEIRTVAVDVRDGLLAAETSQRGFVLTGNEIYLAPYDTAKSLALRRFERLQRLLAENSSVAVSLDRLNAIMREKFAEMDETIALKRQRKDGEASALVGSNRGKTLMDEANIFFTGIVLAADDRLSVQIARQLSDFAWLGRTTIAGGVMIAIVVAMAAASLLRHTQALGAAKRQLEGLNSELENRVMARTADLTRANEDVQRFAYIVTHDLRAPLVNIMGFTSEVETAVVSLQKLIDDHGVGLKPGDNKIASAKQMAANDLEEAIRFIRSSTRKMDRLINAILQLSREGRRPLRSESVAIADIIESSASGIGHQLKEAAGEINVDLSAKTVETDRLALEQIIANLLDNAVKYRSGDRALRIDIRASATPSGRIAIEIEDNGRGIATQDLERVFELFRRSGVQDQPGEGIGLAHVRATVRRLGGDVAVTSSLDVGTRFTIELPRGANFSEKTSA